MQYFKVVARSKLLLSVLIASLLGIFSVFLLRVLFLDAHFESHKFFDYGPSLFNDQHPTALLYQYILLVLIMTGAAFLALHMRLYHAVFQRMGYLNNARGVVVVFAACWAIFITIIFMLTNRADVMHLGACLGLIAILSGQVFLDSLYSRHPYYLKVTDWIPRVFTCLFLVMVFFHLPKLEVLLRMNEASQLKAQSTLYLTSMVIFSGVLGYFLAARMNKVDAWPLAFLLAVIYLVSIRESWVYWGLDAFHEGETFITPALLFDSEYPFLESFFPVHGLGRNIFHGYYAALFSDNNLYFYRLIQAYTYPVVHVLIAAFMYKYTQSVALPLAFYVLSYLAGFIEERDISPWFFILFLLLPVTASVQQRSTHIRLVLLGIVLFFLSIYSLEYFVFVPIAMMGIGLYYVVGLLQGRNKGLPWIHLGYLGALLLFILLLGDKFGAWMDAIINALNKSPNLLERTFERPAWPSIGYLSIVMVFFPLLIFHLSAVVNFFYNIQQRLSPKAIVVPLFSMISLMFFVRAFNRSDVGHILYAYGAAIPIVLGLAIHYKLLTRRIAFQVFVTVLVVVSVDLVYKDRLSMQSLSERFRYDARLPVSAVRPSQQFGQVLAPQNVITADHMNLAELSGLQGLVSKGYRLLDLSNQPVLFYGVVDASLVTNDIHTLFSSGYDEQLDKIQLLEHADDALVIWSGNHWSETLDHTYVETRLPLLSQYLIESYQHVYRAGRFVILAKSPISAMPDIEPIYDQATLINLFNTEYNYGYAAARMSHYPQESVEVLATVHQDQINIADLRPDALLIQVSSDQSSSISLSVSTLQSVVVLKVALQIPVGESTHFVRLSNLPNYQLVNLGSLDISYEGVIDLQSVELLRLD